MMMLTEVTPVPEAALPLEAFKAHLRLGSGFGDENLQDSVLAAFLRAAVSAVEGRTGKVLIERDFTWTLLRWRDRSLQVLPVAPVQSVGAVVIRDAAGGETLLAAASYRLEPDDQYPRLVPSGALLPAVPSGGNVHIAMTAGMAPGWGGLPADLCQAVLMLAAHYYEYRSDTGLHGGCMPFGVTSLIERYRSLRLSLGVVQ